MKAFDESEGEIVGHMTLVWDVDPATLLEAQEHTLTLLYEFLRANHIEVAQ